jgi:hypothetical protein
VQWPDGVDEKLNKSKSKYFLPSKCLKNSNLGLQIPLRHAIQGARVFRIVNSGSKLHGDVLICM